MEKQFKKEKKIKFIISVVNFVHNFIVVVMCMKLFSYANNIKLSFEMLWITVPIFFVFLNVFLVVFSNNKGVAVSPTNSLLIAFASFGFLGLLSMGTPNGLYEIMNLSTLAIIVWILKIFLKIKEYEIFAKPTLVHELGHAFILRTSEKAIIKDIEIYPQKMYDGRITWEGSMENFEPYFTLKHLIAGDVAVAYMLHDKTSIDYLHYRRTLYRELWSTSADISDEYTIKILEVMKDKSTLVRMVKEIETMLEENRELFESEMKRHRRKRHFSVEHLRSIEEQGKLAV